MRAFVVHESMFGNTAQIARAVAEYLANRSDPDVALIVAGGPTHAFDKLPPQSLKLPPERRVLTPHLVPGPSAARFRRSSGRLS
jgi:hypothetical protein